MLPLLLGMLLAPGQAPGYDPQPFLRLEPGGPTTQVTSLAFSPDGELLYVAGFDKVVHVWRRDLRSGRYELTPTTYRIPLGPGYDGAINAIAMSGDGKSLAVGGLGVARGAAGFRDLGLVLPAAGGLTDDMRLDRGVIWIFDTATRDAHPLRGHTGPVLALAFVPGRTDRLVSAARGWDGATSALVGEMKLWDATSGKELAQARLPNPLLKPSLSVHPVPNQPDRHECLIAWADGVLRRWTITASGAEALQETKLTWTAPVRLAGAERVPGTNRLLLAALSNRPLLYLGEDANAELRPTDEQVVPELGTQVPRTFCLIGRDAAAVALRLPGTPEQSGYRLGLLDLGSRRLTLNVPLWSRADAVPVLAASPRGDVLAIAGAPDHGVRLFKLPLKENAESIQVLRGGGSRFTSASFVTRGATELGLHLKDASGELVFDVQKQELVGATGWKPAGATPPVKVTTPLPPVPAPVPHTFRGSQANEICTITVEPTQRVDGQVFVQPPGLTSPLLAVALFDIDAGPLLVLHDAKTGAQVRHYVGHGGPIRSVAASADGRFLVTAADDQTVAVWSLADIHWVHGRRGQVAGLAVVEREGKLVVASVPAKATLKVGDVVEAIIDDAGKQRPLKLAREFYDAVSLITPGRNVQVRVLGQADPVILTVGQGVDQRKPLLTLYLTQGAALEREWLAWSPTGPYDRSALKVERLLGWHFNTGKTDPPATLAVAGEYRQRFLKPGLVKHLLATGEIGSALDAWKRAQPAQPPASLTWLVHEESAAPPAVPTSSIRMKQSKLVIRLAAVGLTEDDRLGDAKWQLADGPWNDFRLNPIAEAEWQSMIDVGPTHKPRRLQVKAAGVAQDFELLPDQPSAAPLRPLDASFLTRQPAPEERRITEEPPKSQDQRPVLELLHPTPGSALVGSTVAPRCRVRSTTPLQTLDVRIGTTEQRIMITEQDGIVELPTFPLTPGPNVIELRAVNAAGKTVTTAIVSHVPAPVRVVLETPSVGFHQGHQILLGTNGQPLVVSEPSGKLTLRGHVTWPAEKKSQAFDGQVRVHVNGFQQRPVLLAEPRDGKRAFTCEIVLTRESGNVIELELPHLAAELGEASRWLVDCAKPQLPSTLHLLIVGVGQTDSELLKQRALKALEAARGAGGAFTRVETQVLSGPDITAGQVLYQLHRLRAILERRPAGTEAVLIYFAGPELLGPAGPFLSTHPNLQMPTSSRILPRNHLAGVLHEMQGAKVVLLDTVRPSGEASPRAWSWPEDARFALLGYAWPKALPAGTGAPLLLALEESRADQGQPIRLSDVAAAAERLRPDWAKHVSDPAGLSYERHVPEELKPLVVRQGR